MSKYQTYPEYKDSGVEWFGSIPKHWNVAGFKKYLASIVDYRGKTPNKTDDGILLVTARNIKKGKLEYSLSKEYISPQDYADVMSRGTPNIGDVLFTTEAPLGEVANVDMTNIALAQRIIKFSGNKQFLDNYYLKYLIMSEEFQQSLNLYSSGSTAQGIKAERFVYLRKLLPPLNEQTKIAAFLDHETAKIDTLIEKQQQLIELLKEKRQAVISHAVTKGLNPDAPMKDSGVEWLGEVPEHWDLTPLKYLCNFKGGGTPTKDNLNYWENGTIPWVSPKDMKSFWINKTQDYVTELAVKESSTNIIFEGSLMMVVRSGILQRTIPIAINTVPVTMNQDMKALLFNNKMLTEYAAYFIIGNIPQLLLEWSKEGATVESIEHEYLANSYFPVPPKEEQEKIICTIKSQLELFDNLETQAQQAIKLMQERRTALISAAVTGKIDVRNWVAPTTSSDTNEAQQEVSV